MRETPKRLPIEGIDRFFGDSSAVFAVELVEPTTELED